MRQVEVGNSIIFWSSFFLKKGRIRIGGLAQTAHLDYLLFRDNYFRRVVRFERARTVRVLRTAFLLRVFRTTFRAVFRTVRFVLVFTMYYLHHVN